MCSAALGHALSPFQVDKPDTAAVAAEEGLLLCPSLCLCFLPILLGLQG